MGDRFLEDLLYERIRDLQENKGFTRGQGVNKRENGRSRNKRRMNSKGNNL